MSDDKSQHNVSKLESEKKGSDVVIEDNVIESDNTQVVDSKQRSDVVIEDKVIESDNIQVVDSKQRSPEKIKRKDYVRSKMQINKAKRTLLLKGTKMGQKPKHQCYKKQKYTAKSSVPKKAGGGE